MREHQLSVQRACRVVRLSRAAYYRPPVPTSRRDAVVIAAGATRAEAEDRRDNERVQDDRPDPVALAPDAPPRLVHVAPRHRRVLGP